MFPRLLIPTLRDAATHFPVVVVLGARQVGKTTLAAAAFPGHRYLDLEDPRTAERFRVDARFELDAGGDALILDEAQAVPAVFDALRGAVDAQRSRAGRYIVLGSAQPALVRGVSESLAGRASVIELDPLTAQEASEGLQSQPWRQLWLKGGFPDALRGDSRRWWESYLRLLLERDLPQYGVRADPLFMRRLLTMLAHQHGGLLNASALGGFAGRVAPHAAAPPRRARVGLSAAPAAALLSQRWQAADQVAQGVSARQRLAAPPVEHLHLGATGLAPLTRRQLGRLCD